MGAERTYEPLLCHFCDRPATLLAKWNGEYPEEMLVCDEHKWTAYS